MNRSAAERSLAVLLGAVGFLCPGRAPALGLSDIQVGSQLNQPFQARIEILGVSDEEWPHVRASLAPSPWDIDVARPEVLSSVKLRATEDVDHRHFIELRSAQVITEPVFELPVEVAAPTGRVVRTYSVLLDPPVLQRGAQDSSAPTEAREEGRPGGELAAAANSSTAASSRVSANTPAAASQPVTPNAAPAASAPIVANPLTTADQLATTNAATFSTPAPDPPAAANTTAVPPASVAAREPSSATYTVRRSDSLARIVRRLGARTASDRSRLMSWIFEHNPSAFSGAMRRLHTGAVLTLPSEFPVSELAAATRRRVPATASGRAHSRDSQPQMQVSVSQRPAQIGQQELLATQLAALQQMLSGMQQTISAQQAEIHNLMATIAAQEAASRQPARVSPPRAAESAEANSSVSDVGPRIYSSIAGLGVTVALGLALAAFVRRQRSAVIATGAADQRTHSPMSMAAAMTVDSPSMPTSTPTLPTANASTPTGNASRSTASVATSAPAPVAQSVMDAPNPTRRASHQVEPPQERTPRGRDPDPTDRYPMSGNTPTRFDSWDELESSPADTVAMDTARLLAALESQMEPAREPAPVAKGSESLIEQEIMKILESSDEPEPGEEGEGETLPRGRGQYSN